MASEAEWAEFERQLRALFERADSAYYRPWESRPAYDSYFSKSVVSIECHMPIDTASDETPDNVKRGMN